MPSSSRRVVPWRSSRSSMRRSRRRISRRAVRSWSMNAWSCARRYLPAGVGQAAGSRCSRRRRRLSIFPWLVSWSRTSVGSLEIWSATWCSIDVRAPTRVLRRSSTASISATKGVIDLQRLDRAEGGLGQQRPRGRDRVDGVGLVQPPRAALRGRARRGDLAGVEARSGQSDPDMGSPFRRSLHADLAHAVRVEQIDRRSAAGGSVVVRGRADRSALNDFEPWNRLWMGL